MKTKKKPGREKWHDGLYVEIYDLAREGMNRSAIAQVIGVNVGTLKRWIEEKPALAAAIKKAKAGREDMGKSETFMEYVYKMLPPEVQQVWDKLCEFELEENPFRKAELLTKQSKRIRQYLFVHAMISCHFNASEACRKTGVSKSLYDTWTATDPGFSQLIEEIFWHKKNFFDSALVRLVKEGDTSATIFANKTINRDRGYDMKVEHVHSGAIAHGVVDVESLDIPIEMRRQLLAASRAKQLEAARASGEIIDADIELLEHKEGVE